MFPLCKPMKIDGVSSENSSVQFLVQFPLPNSVHELPTRLRVVSEDLADNFLHRFDSANNVRVCTIHIRYGHTGNSGIGIVPVPGVPVMTRPSRTGLGRVGEPWCKLTVPVMVQWDCLNCNERMVPRHYLDWENPFIQDDIFCNNSNNHGFACIQPLLVFLNFIAEHHEDFWICKTYHIM
ncbi:unnamed protein product [Coffea canephora]|uniref:DH200=94 genomic scaffold, scaffold_896 n=1 Tax=Coffea canephora TaxID=49390 RepID=A0A068VK92_COFCA|nr:unnamed protein product [Coffea canephora]